MHQFTKVPILRDEHALVIQSALQNLLVRRAFRDFDNRNHIMACFAQRPDDRPGAAFVGQKVHASGFARNRHVGQQHYFLVSYAGRAIGHRRQDILCCEVRIVFQQFTLARALSELAQN
jgi:hypothetical protein